MIKAPFTPEQVAALNDYQTDGRFHPYTCPGEHPTCHENRELIATEQGLVCYCGRYSQDWAHPHTAHPPIPGEETHRARHPEDFK